MTEGARPATDADRSDYMRRWRAKNRDKIHAGVLRQLEKRRGNPEYARAHREIRARVKDRPHNKRAVRAAASRYRERHPEKTRAKHRVLTALRNGTLVRPTHCPRCGREDPRRCDGRSGIHAHHHDYTKPLEVEWLCRICHQDEHGGYIHAPAEQAGETP